MDSKKTLLEKLYSENCNCQRCKLHTTRNKFVFGYGNPEANIMFIGEGPGKDEDLQQGNCIKILLFF